MINPYNTINNTLHIMDLIAEKHKALATNIANMDTPNYRRKDISFAQYLGDGYNPLETKLAQKMGPSPVLTETSDAPINPAMELTEMQRNALMYTVTARRITSLITQMKTVINIGNG